MNLTINSLPSRTWNHLKMNESFLSVEGEFTNHTPEARWDSRQIRWEPDAAWESPVYRGRSRDLSALTAPARTALAETAPGTSMTAPVILTWDLENAEQAASRLVLHAGANSTLCAVLLLTSQPDSRCIAALQTEISAEAGASVQLYVAQLLGKDSICVNDICGICRDGASVSLTRLELGAGKAYSDCRTDLLGKGSRFTADIAYHVLGGQMLDMNYDVLHHGANTESLMEVTGTLEEDARKIFRGTIDFQQGCKGARGTENENVLLLGDNMVNQTIPLILCKEEDVEGNHGASIGRLDEKVLFYLGTRGISQQAAQQMIAQAHIESVCSKIPDEAIRDQVHEFEQQRGLFHAPEL